MQPDHHVAIADALRGCKAVRTPDDIVELPQITRPVAGDQFRRGIDCNIGMAAVRVPFGVAPFGHEVRPFADFVASFVEAGKADRQNVDPVVEILAKFAVAYPGAQVGVGANDEAYVRVDGRGRAAQWAEGARFQNLQQACLGIQRQGVDFVDQQGSRARPCQRAGVITHRACKRPALPSGELRQLHVRGHGEQVDHLEGAVRSWRMMVAPLGQAGLAGPGRTGYQQRLVLVSERTNKVQHVLHALTDHRHQHIWFFILRRFFG